MEHLTASFARNPVAGNLLMVLLLVGGLLVALNLELRTLPDLEPIKVDVTLGFPGATPAEVEQDLTRRVEERLLAVKGVGRVTSHAFEGAGLVEAYLEAFADPRQVVEDIRATVTGMERFPPAGAEQPEVMLRTAASRVQTLAVISPTLGEYGLHAAAEKVRDDLMALPSVSVVTPFSAREREVTIEVAEETLREHQLTINSVAQAIRSASLNLSSGELHTDAGGVVVRTHAKRLRGDDFKDIVVRAGLDGGVLRLGDIARVTDAFSEDRLLTEVDGKRSILLTIVLPVGQERRGIAEDVRAFLAEYTPPPGVDVVVWNDRERYFTAHMGLVVSNGVLGFVLVLLFLSLVFDFRISTWVAVGVPTALLGGVLLFPVFDLEIHAVSLLALVLVIGIVVDDAVVVGESIASRRERGETGIEAAINGARAVRGPVVVGVLTTIIAFLPMLFVYGPAGQVLNVLPLVVLAVLATSLVEAFLILPAHLAPDAPWSRPPMSGVQERARRRLDRFRDDIVVPAVSAAVRRPWVVIAGCVAFLFGSLLLVWTGTIGYVFFSATQAAPIKADITMPAGTPFDVTAATARRFVESAQRVNAKLEDEPITGVAVSVGDQFSISGVDVPEVEPRTNVASVIVDLRDEADRDTPLDTVMELWRAEVGPLASAEQVNYGTAGGVLEQQLGFVLTHEDDEALVAAAERLRGVLDGMPTLTGVTDTLALGKRHFDVELTPLGRSAGLTAREVAMQLRARYVGLEVQRFQRGREEMRVVVRYPEERRQSLAELRNERIQRADGSSVPLFAVARVTESRGFASLKRWDGERAVWVSATFNAAVATPGELQARLAPTLAALKSEHAGLGIRSDDRMLGQTLVADAMAYTVPVALLAIYVLIAVLFRSYMQPLIVLAGIPFAAAGAVLAHLLLGYDLTAASLFGIIAAAGVVVNDTLVLMDRYNAIRADADVPAVAAVSAAVRQRFRAILFTTVTTVVGLLPMLYITSEFTNIFAPMVVSIVGGLIAANAGILFAIPAVLLIVEQVAERGWLFRAPARAA